MLETIWLFLSHPMVADVDDKMIAETWKCLFQELRESLQNHEALLNQRLWLGIGI